MTTTMIRKIAQYILFFAFLTPLIFLPQWFTFPYIVPKVVFFRTLVLVAGGLAVAVWWAERSGKLGKHGRPSFLHIAVGAFAASLIISTILGVDWYRSFWDNHERMLGTFTVIHYILFFFLCRFFWQRDEDWRRAFVVFGAVGVVVVGIGIIQKFWPEFLFNRGTSRVVSTLGNPIYLGGYGLFLFFSSAISWLKTPGRWRWYFVVVGLLGIVAILVSGTRGTMLGLMGGLFVVLIASALGQGIQPRIRQAALVLCILLFSLGVGLFFLRHQPIVRQLPGVGSIVAGSWFEGSGHTRLLAWQIGLRAWRDHAVLGWGPNNFYYAFNTYYDPVFLRFGFQETWFDNAHNTFVNTITTQGLLGIVVYMGLFVAALYQLWRARTHERVWGISPAIIAIGFLVAHAIHNFFVFENPTSYLYFFFFLAFVDHVTEIKKSEDANEAKPISIGVLGGAIMVTGILVFLTNVNVSAANHLGFRSRVLMSQGKVAESLSAYEAARQWRSPYGGDIGWDLANGTLDILPRVYYENRDLARQLYDTAAGAMEAYVRRFPLDVRGHLAYMDILRSGGMVLFELPVQSIVESELEVAASLSPRRQQVAYSRITFLAGTGHMTEAITEAKAVVAADPAVADGYYTLARLYDFQGAYKQILPVLDQAIVRGVRFTDPEQQAFLAESYEREGRFHDALYWYDQAFRATGNERIAYKRDELSRQTQLTVPTSVEAFFPFTKFATTTFEL